MAWQDRIVEYPGRVRLTQAQDLNGDIPDVYTLTLEEGTVTDEGTPLNAANLISETNELINAIVDARLAGIQVSEIQTGVAKVKTVNNNNAKLNVQFAKPFSKTPIVTATANTSVPNIVNVAVSNVTTTGFELYVYRNSAPITQSVHWQAMA